MKYSIIAVGIFSFLLAGQTAAHPEQDNMGSTENIVDGSSSSLVVKPTKAITEESEFSAIESRKQPVNQSRKLLEDTYDYIPSSWIESY